MIPQSSIVPIAAVVLLVIMQLSAFFHGFPLQEERIVERVALNETAVINLKDASNATAKKVYVVWTYPLAPLHASEDRLLPNEVLLCAYQEACGKWNPVVPPWERINLRGLTYDTPYYESVLNQMFEKVRLGSAYLDHVQSMTLLALLQKNPDSCVRSWGDRSMTLCHDNATQFALEYDPLNASSIAPLIPASKPDMSSLTFAYQHYGNGGNSGDDIQSLTGIQFNPFVNHYFSRDFGWPKGARGHVIANAWHGFTFKFPPKTPETVNITMLAMHYAGKGQDVIAAPASMEYLERYNREVGPVGARDTHTLAFLQSLNITSYLSRCMTLMLQLGCNCNGCPPCQEKTEIAVHDVDMSVLPKHAQQQLKGAIRLTAVMKRKHKRTVVTKSRYAFNLLSIYANRAKVVVTSRLHSALPALALGNPVIFVDTETLPGGSSKRLEGIKDLLHVYRPNMDNWTFDLDNMPPNPGLNIVDRNRAAFWNYLKRRSSYYEDSARLHGMIPLQRLGKKQPRQQLDVQATFHFVVVSSSQSLPSWQFVRALESVFFHHPDAQVIIHSNSLPRLGTRLDTFQETGYDLTVQPYDLAELLKQVSTKSGDAIDRCLSELQQDDPDRDLFEMGLVGLLTVGKYGGVYLNNDMFLQKPLSIETQNSVGAGGSFLATEPGHAAVVAVVDWVLDEYPNRRDEWVGPGRVQTSIVESGLFKPLVNLKPEEMVVLEDSVAKHCFTSKIDDVDLTRAYAVRIPTSVLDAQETTISGTTCDELLYHHCIYCDELHTEGGPVPPVKSA